VSDTLRLSVNDRLIEAEAKSLGQRIPEPLHRRLIELCDRVYDAGQPQRPTKADMLAALILAAPACAENLIELLNTYGRARVGDAILDRDEHADVIDFARRTPGPRRGTA
jgi:hypothetical protein